ncbi:MAG: hypothetical protein H6933_03520 [Burkholderiaceae bacterium]|nr:hypothetical protein [Burkholderiaceae bacterium]
MTVETVNASGKTEAAEALPRESVETVLGAIASELWSARDLLVNADDVTREMMGAIAMIEKAGALAEEAVMACGGAGVAELRHWLYGTSTAAALDALKARGGTLVRGEETTAT